MAETRSRMTIRKQPSGRFYAVLKAGRSYAAGRTFDAKRAAQAWLARERAALAGGVDPRAGRATVRTLLPVWLDERKHSVSARTYTADAALPRLVPTALGALSINAVTDPEITRALIVLTKVAWQSHRCVVSEIRCRRSLHGIDAWTGLRWSELRAMRVRDFVEVPLPILVVQRAEPEGVEIKSTKSGRTRRVPIADRILQLVRGMAVDRDADARLFVTGSGHQLHATAFKRTLARTTVADGRRIHDLRHTAACLWMARGVDPVTVQAWMGHASIATTNLYLHHLGTSADRAGLDRLNAREHKGGTRQPGAEESQA